MESLCESQIAIQLNESNAILFFEMAEDRMYKNLSLACLDYILINFDSIEGFKNLRSNLQKEITKRLNKTIQLLFLTFFLNFQMLNYKHVSRNFHSIFK